MLNELPSAPSVFQNIINEVLRDFLQKFVIAYIADILIYSPDLPSHVKHVCLVLQRLLENQLFIKGKKCKFLKAKISFLEYNIDSTGVSIEQKKVCAVLQWPTR